MIKEQPIKTALFFGVFFAIACGMNGQRMWQFSKDTVITWNYQQGDEFNSSIIDLSYWQYVGSSRSLYSNKEQEYYTDGENHVLGNGTLKLIAKKDSVFRRTVDWLNDNDSLFTGKKFERINKSWHSYTSGELISREKFSTGFFECRFKIPEQSGYWPAFWLYGGSPNEEIDMMECKTEKPRQIHIDTHCGNRCDYMNYFFKKRSFGGWLKTKYDFSQEFHVAACSWDENQIRFYLDGECVGISNVAFRVPKNMAINLAVPSNEGPFHPAPAITDTVPAVFEIDYVRVWDTQPTINRKHAGITHVDTSNLLLSKSMVKTKKRTVYGKKSEHKNESVFVSFFRDKDVIQVYALGKFTEGKPTYRIEAQNGGTVLAGFIDQQIDHIPITQLKKGQYTLTITCNGKSMDELIVVD